jgi:hypothetical protein
MPWIILEVVLRRRLRGMHWILVRERSNLI